MMRASDSSALLGSLNQLGSGRIICNNGSLSLAISTDFRQIHPLGHSLIFSGGLLELEPESFQILVSTASCGLGLGISLFDDQKNLSVVFHFCHGSEWKRWMENHIQSGLLEPNPKTELVPKNLCWCDLWPPTKEKKHATAGSLLEQRIGSITESQTVEATLHAQNLELTTVIHPASFDILASSVRFWDRPRTRVCYADLLSLDPQQNENYVALRG
ncbi:MAG: hypothetical protein ACSHX7_05830 [Luteolibacter sp.]